MWGHWGDRSPHSYLPPVSDSQSHPGLYPVPLICKAKAPCALHPIFGEQHPGHHPAPSTPGPPDRCAPPEPQSPSGAAASPRCRRCRRWCPNRGERLRDPCGADSGGTGRTCEGISPSLPWGACCACHLLSNEFWVQGLTQSTAGTGDRASSALSSCGCRSSLDTPTRVRGEVYTA